MSMKNNLTMSILDKAEKEGCASSPLVFSFCSTDLPTSDAVLAQAWYVFRSVQVYSALTGILATTGVWLKDWYARPRSCGPPRSSSCSRSRSSTAVPSFSDTASSGERTPLATDLPHLYHASLTIRSSSAHNASVPIAVHLDHATSAEHLELAIGFAEKQGVKFDSIMVDCSHADVCPSIPPHIDDADRGVVTE